MNGLGKLSEVIRQQGEKHRAKLEQQHADFLEAVAKIATCNAPPFVETNDKLSTVYLAISNLARLALQVGA